MGTRQQPAPKARKRQLIIQEMADETLVYDEGNHKAHCLNKTAAFIWKHCDGRTGVAQITRLMEKQMKVAVTEQVVWHALEQMEKSGLLESTVTRPAQVGLMSRRALVRQIGIAAITVPLVTSIVAPTAAEAQTVTCAGNGQSCETLPCCPGFNCDGICFPD
jgi:Coenzyme PQQ synthesis protein D (PqqD)